MTSLALTQRRLNRQTFPQNLMEEFMSTQIARKKLFAAAGFALIVLSRGLAIAEPQDVEAIENRLQQYEDRFNQGDAEAVAELYSEDVIYYGPLGQVFEGRDAVRQRYQGSLAAGFSDMTIDVIEIRVLDDIAYDVARYTISSPAGEPLTGYHLGVLEKKDAEWLVQRTLVNVVMPQPPTE